MSIAELRSDPPALRAAFDSVMGDASGSLCLMRGTNVLAEYSSGPWAANAADAASHVFGFSLTKGVTASVVAWLVGNGALKYEQRISSVWAEFAAHGKGELTLGQLLTHQAGLSAVPQWLDEDPSLYGDTERIEADLAAREPLYKPGTDCGYHALTFGWLVNAFVRRATGAMIRDHAQTMFAELGVHQLALRRSDLHLDALVAPLEMVSDAGSAAAESRSPSGAYVGIRPRSETRDALGGKALGLHLVDPATWDIEQPAVNSLCTSVGLARLYAAIGTRENEALSKGMSSALRQRCDRRDRVLGFPMHWQGGFQAMLSTRGYEPNLIGHRGFGGSGGWVDLSTEVACAFTTPRMAAQPFMDFRFAELTAAVCAVLGTEPPYSRTARAAQTS